MLGVGGGVVTDIAGFVASVFLRGIKFGFVSTSLLGQVDAAIGGKNGVNFGGLKNIIGVINQPEFVICDISMLKTLPKREVKSGFAEIIKYGIIQDISILEILEREQDKINSLDLMVLEKLIYRSISVKSSIVSKDEHETGLRRVLNFGHTIGHAIELTNDLTHGEAVSIGMVVSLGISEKKGYIGNETVLKVKKLLKEYSLPVAFSNDKEEIIRQVVFDKKNEKNGINFILIKEPGKALIEKMSIKKLSDMLNKI